MSQSLTTLVTADKRDLAMKGPLAVTHLLTGDQTDDDLGISEFALEGGVLAAPLHTHTREDEISYVLEGRMGALVGDEVVEAGPGDVLFKPRALPHTFWNPGAKRLRVLEVIRPAGLQGYFNRLDEILSKEGDPDFAAILSLAAEYGLEMDPSSIPDLVQRFGVTLPG